jgi:hypothetical protein
MPCDSSSLTEHCGRTWPHIVWMPKIENILLKSRSAVAELGLIWLSLENELLGILYGTTLG